MRGAGRDLYEAIAAEVDGLDVVAQLAIVHAFQTGAPWLSLPQAIRSAFDRAAGALVTRSATPEPR